MRISKTLMKLNDWENSKEEKNLYQPDITRHR